MLAAGEKLNIFLLTGISNINIVLIKKKNIVVVNSKLKHKLCKTINKNQKKIDFHLRG